MRLKSKETRPKARALFNSLPLLRGVKEVRVVWVAPYKERSWRSARATLARHGIKATAEGLAAGGINADEAQLQHANDLGAGLLVVGAYAHSRVREYIFGGAIQHVLAHATIPVLLSH